MSDTSRDIDFGPLARRLGYALRRAQIAVFEDFITTCAEADIRPGQYSALTIIDCNPGLSQREVAAALGIKTPNFVAMLDGLEARGLVVRKPQADDKRRYALEITRQGRRLIGRLHRLADAHEARLITRMGAKGHGAMFEMLAAIATMSEEKRPAKRIRPAKGAATPAAART